MAAALQGSPTSVTLPRDPLLGPPGAVGQLTLSYCDTGALRALRSVCRGAHRAAMNPLLFCRFFERSGDVPPSTVSPRLELGRKELFRRNLARNLSLTRSFPGAHRAAILFATFSPNGQIIASASEDGTLKLWNSETGTCFHTIQAGRIEACSFGPDGRMLLLASADDVILWDIESCTSIRVLKEHTNAVYTCAISPNGRDIISGSQDKSLQLWSTPGDLLRQLELTNSPERLVIGVAQKFTVGHLPEAWDLFGRLHSDVKKRIYAHLREIKQPGGAVAENFGELAFHHKVEAVTNAERILALHRHLKTTVLNAMQLDLDAPMSTLETQELLARFDALPLSIRALVHHQMHLMELQGDMPDNLKPLFFSGKLTTNKQRREAIVRALATQ